MKLEDRPTVQQELTLEYIKHMGGDNTSETIDLIESKARKLENTINGLVFVNTVEKYSWEETAIQIKIVCGVDAEVDVIKQAMQQLQAEITRELQGEESYWS